MDFRELKYKDMPSASELLGMVFSEFVGPGYSDEGVENFMHFIHPDELKKFINTGKLIIWGCFDGIVLVGVIAILDYSHISLLFVDKAYHCRGIAKEMLAQSIKYCIEEKPELNAITVNSSPYAVEIYEKLGFIAVGEQSTKNGITYTPMRKSLVDSIPEEDKKAFVRHIKDNELTALLKLYRQLNPDDPDVPEEEHQAVFNGLLKDPGQHLLVVETGGQLTASCTLVIVKNLTRCAKPYGIIENVITLEDCRGRGFGSMLLQKALAIARQKGCYKVMLLTGRGEETIRCYEKAGFQRGKKTGLIVRFDGL